MPALDPATALCRYMGEQPGFQGLRVRDFRRLSGGSIQDNYLLSVEVPQGDAPGLRKWVVRTDAPSRLDLSLDRLQEFAVIQCARVAGVTAPRPLWACADPDVLGAPFIIMEHVGGVAAPSEGSGAGLSDTGARAVTRRLGQELGRLHGIRPPQSRLDFLAVPAAPVAEERVKQYRHALDRLPDAHPALEWGLSWLARNAPAPRPPVLCHGDFRRGNFMLEGERLTGVLDWEFACWGDPREDLGWLCSRSWRFGRPGKEVGGLGDKADLLQAYAQTRGDEIAAHELSYWEIMASLRWGIIALQQLRRHMSGEQPSLELALTGRMLPQIELDLLTQIEETGGLS